MRLRRNRHAERDDRSTGGLRHATHLPPSPAAYVSISFNHSSSEITLTPCFSASFNFEPAPGPATTRSVFFDTEPADLRAHSLRRRLGLIASHLSSEPVNTTVLPATAESARLLDGQHFDLTQQIVQRLDVALLGEELHHRIRHDIADTADVVEIGIGFRWVVVLCPAAASSMASRNASIRAVVPRQQFGITFADVTNAEREDQPVAVRFSGGRRWRRTDYAPRSRRSLRDP